LEFERITIDHADVWPACLCAGWAGRRLAVDRLRYSAEDMAKASWVLAALKRDGWVETRRRGSHRVLVKDDLLRIWAYHDGVDLGGPALARVAKQFGYTVDQLRRL
jgi:predicted RNA binding protein YcfA (HicA-like mRNA interferase family)